MDDILKKSCSFEIIKDIWIRLGTCGIEGQNFSFLEKLEHFEKKILKEKKIAKHSNEVQIVLLRARNFMMQLIMLLCYYVIMFWCLL